MIATTSAQKVISLLLEHYTIDEYYSLMLAARKKYLEQTGRIQEDDPDFEERMSAFNNWYLFHFELGDSKSLFELAKVEGHLPESASYRYSVFQILKYRKDTAVLKDLVTRKKVIIKGSQATLALVPKDIFVGYLLKLEKDWEYLSGLVNLPHELSRILIKDIKKRQKKTTFSQVSFLLFLEKLKVSLKHYSHVDIVTFYQGKAKKYDKQQEG